MDSDDIEIVFENYLSDPQPRLARPGPKKKMVLGRPGPNNGLGFRPGAGPSPGFGRKPELSLESSSEPDFVPCGLFPKLDELPNEVSSMQLIGQGAVV